MESPLIIKNVQVVGKLNQPGRKRCKVDKVICSVRLWRSAVAAAAAVGDDEMPVAVSTATRHRHKSLLSADTLQDQTVLHTHGLNWLLNIFFRWINNYAKR